MYHPYRPLTQYAADLGKDADSQSEPILQLAWWDKLKNTVFYGTFVLQQMFWQSKTLRGSVGEHL